MNNRSKRTIFTNCYDGADLGIPERALPHLSLHASADEIREARDNLLGMMQSFCSACI
jgi:hypothetical protein